jgi:hypothetical protein
LERKCFKNNDLQDGISALGGLEPALRVLFSAIFHGVSLGNFHQSRNLTQQGRETPQDLETRYEGADIEPASLAAWRLLMEQLISSADPAIY